MAGDAAEGTRMIAAGGSGSAGDTFDHLYDYGEVMRGQVARDGINKASIKRVLVRMLSKMQ